MGFSIGKVFKTIEEEMKKYAEVDSIYLPVPNYFPKGLWRNIKAAKQAVKAKQYDIVHITGAEYYLIPFLYNQRVVVTVHDLGFYTNHKGSIRACWKFMGWVFPLKWADRVTFISEKSMLEAKSLIHLREDGLKVIHDAVSPYFVFSSKEPNKEHPVILHIGTMPNKNLDNTILALKGTNYRLRIIGRLTDRQDSLLKQCDIDYSVVENLTDEQIREEYRNCDIVSFPSFYEGFGMPIIEGQATGRPVLTSQLLPMTEVARDSVVYVDPSDADSIRKGFHKIMQNWQEIVDAGLENVKRFSVRKITGEYLQLYNDLSDV